MRWQERTPPITEVQCQQSGEPVGVAEILFGAHSTASQDRVVARLDQLDESIQVKFAELDERVRGEFSELAQLVRRGFLEQFRREQRFVESHCPRVFTLRPVGAATWPGKVRKLLETRWELQLFCEAPSCWHPTVAHEASGRYEIKTPEIWVKTLVPYLNGLVRVLKFTMPIVGPWLDMTTSDYELWLEDRIELMKGLVENLSEVEVGHPIEGIAADRAKDVAGAGLRGLRKLLVDLDPSQTWGGLRKILTPEGHYFWLCEWHADEFVSSGH